MAIDTPIATEPGASESLGRAAGGLRETGDLTAFAGQSLRQLPGSIRYFSEALRLGAEVIRGTTFLMFVMGGFFGATAATFFFFLLHSIGASDYLGVTAFGVTRIGAVTMFGYVFVAKVGCGMAAELGAMRIQEEIDALASTGVDPLRYAVGTRVLATLLFLPVGSAVVTLGAAGGAYLDGVVVLHGVAGHAFLQLYWGLQDVGDQLRIFVAQAGIALITTVTACFYGLRAGGGPSGVGTVVARSLVVNLVLLHVVAAFFAVLFYGTVLRLPIGG